MLEAILNLITLPFVYFIQTVTTFGEVSFCPMAMVVVVL